MPMTAEGSNSGFAEFLTARASLLESLFALSNAARWNVPYDEFAAALCRGAARHFGAGKPSVYAAETYLRALHLEDLALACALRRGSEAAWEHFVANYRPVLYAAACAIVGQGGATRARELADSLYAELYGLDRSAGARKTSLLDYFHGRSKLGTWLRTILVQRHVDALRASRRTESLDDETAPQGAFSRERADSAFENVDPDRARLLPRLFEAISEAVAALPAPDRLVLSLYYVQELTLARIARMRGVHEATVSRRLQNIRIELREGVEILLARGSAARNGRPAQRALSPTEIRRCLDYVLEDGSFDLTAALAENRIMEPGEGK